MKLREAPRRSYSGAQMTNKKGRRVETITTAKIEDGEAILTTDVDTLSAKHDYNAYLDLLRRDSTMV